jgi:hypothetical protein
LIKRLDELHSPVIVAMLTMGEVQVPPDDIIDVIAVGDRRVPASGAVAVSALMSVTGM